VDLYIHPNVFMPQCLLRQHKDNFLYIIQVYLQSVQVLSVNWLKEVDECLVEGRSLALGRIGSGARCDLVGQL
jgi:hypothetical protein